MDEVYLPMLTRVDSGARVWQPPENLQATGGGEQSMTNLIANPGFEDGAKGWSNAFPTDGSDDNNVMPHSGEYYSFTRNDNSVTSDGFDVTPGATLHASAWGYSPVPSRDMWLTIVFNDGSSVTSVRQRLSAGIWGNVQMETTVPRNASQAHIEISGSTWQRIDDVEVTEEI